MPDYNTMIDVVSLLAQARARQLSVPPGSKARCSCCLDLVLGPLGGSGECDHCERHKREYHTKKCFHGVPGEQRYQGNPLTLLDLENLIEMEKKTFKGPWQYEKWAIDCPSLHEGDREDCGYEHNVATVTSPDEYPAYPDDPQVVAMFDVPGIEEFAHHNGEFIVALRNSFAELVRLAQIGLRHEAAANVAAVVGDSTISVT